MPTTMLMPGMVGIEQHMSNVEIERIHSITAKDYILNWFIQRIPTNKEDLPNIKPSRAGSKILILKSGPGSGKSVTIGTEIYLKFPYLTISTIDIFLKTDYFT